MATLSSPLDGLIRIIVANSANGVLVGVGVFVVVGLVVGVGVGVIVLLCVGAGVAEVVVGFVGADVGV